MIELDNLEHAIIHYVHDNGKEPTIIVIHPNTFYEMTRYVEQSSTIRTSNTILCEYKGIEIVRSFDVKEGEFKM